MKKDVICDHCGVTFCKYIKKSKPSRRNYCCLDCKKSDKNSYVSEWSDERKLAYSIQVTGENNPNYKDGFDGDKAYRKICFKYHPKRCCICGFDHIVEVHHMDCNKNNNNSDNLIPLCPNHHRMFHSRYRQLVSPLIEEYINNNRV